ncbi:molybdenum cofactor guanylyltransferase [Candidatus Thioglobus sp.]|nr:molybdenum cofactor guanylyltransferase [Candidatus Thioglobus sp.]
MKKIFQNEISAVILAGGQGLRMDGMDKGLVEFRGLPLIAHVTSVIESKVDRIFISANRSFDAYSFYGEVIEDDLVGFQGPLAGISKALKVCSTDYLIVLPCDSPLVDSQLVDELINKMEQRDADICVAHDGSIMHATFALMKSNLNNSLEQFLDEGGRKMALWYRQQKLERVDVSDRLVVLTNLNKPEDLDF